MQSFCGHVGWAGTWRDWACCSKHPRLSCLHTSLLHFSTSCPLHPRSNWTQDSRWEVGQRGGCFREGERRDGILHMGCQQLGSGEENGGCMGWHCVPNELAIPLHNCVAHFPLFKGFKDSTRQTMQSYTCLHRSKHH